MTAPRNPDDLIRAFLGEGETDLPDRAFDAVRSEIHRTRQRVAIGPWREPTMSIFARVAIAAVAVLAVGLAWVNLSPNLPGVGGQPTPTPSPTPSPQPLTEEFVPLGAGAHVAGNPFIVRVTFTVPVGWEGGIGGQYFASLNPIGRPGGVNFLDAGNLYADACHFDAGMRDPSFPPAGPAPKDLAYALANIGSYNTSGPSDITLAGYTGKELTLRAPDSFDGCTLSPDGYAVWQLPLGANYTMQAGQISRLLMLDVNGQRLVIDIPQLPGQTAKELGEAQRIVDSIQIEPAH